MHLQHNSSAGLEPVEPLEKELPDGQKTMSLGEIIRLADAHEYSQAIEALNQILANENGYTSENLAAAHWHRAVLYLVQDESKSKEQQLPEALQDLYAVAKQVTTQEAAVPNDNFNLQSIRFGSPVFVKPGQASKQVIEWMKSIQ